MIAGTVEKYRIMSEEVENRPWYEVLLRLDILAKMTKNSISSASARSRMLGTRCLDKERRQHSGGIGSYTPILLNAKAR